MSAPRWQVGPRCAIRAPLLPVETLTGAGSRDWLDALLRRPDVSEAVWLASPSLHASLETWRAAPDSDSGRAAEQALVRYVARMASRSTPFGLFAGIGVGDVVADHATTIAVGAAHRRRTRLDNELLHRLTTALARHPDVRAALTWRPNSSLVAVAGQLRYAEARLGDAGAGIVYHLISVAPTPYLEATLARARIGVRLAELTAALAAEVDGISRDDAAAYVDELVAAQLLVPALGVVVTGGDPLAAVIAQLVDAGLDDHADRLRAVQRAIEAIDAADVGGELTRYPALATMLEAVLRAVGDDTRVEPARMVQVDLGLAIAARVGRRAVAAVERTVDALRRITPRRSDDALTRFRAGFRERWEDQEVPLAEVLDEEAGLGFGAATGPGSEGAPLLGGLRFPGPPIEARVAWGPRETWLLRRLAQLWERGEHELVLGDDALRALATAEPAPMPDAWSAMIRIGHDPRGRLALLVEGTGGPSGARLLGRFCHVDPRIEAMVRDHLRAEEALVPHAAFAEIVHLAEGRNGNVLCRPVLRDHELVFLGMSGAPAAQQLDLDDLLVAIRGDRVVLRSRRLDREVVPRMTTAHNSRAGGLGVYRFLTALAAQDGAGVGWSWGALDEAPRLPRVRIGDAIVAREQWRLDAAELQALARATRLGRAHGFEAMQAMRATRGLPRWIALGDGDHELVIDLDHTLLVDALIDAMGTGNHAILREVFPALDEAVVVGPDGHHASEIVLTFVRTERAPATPPVPAPPSTARRFTPGSRWLYAKLYGGVSSADRVLREAIAPVVRAALASGAAHRWFFVRYHDPHPHLRLRIDGDPARLLAEVLPALDRAVEPLLADGTLWRIQLDTYQREVERYGGPEIVELCEDVFWHDSDAALAIVESLDGEAGGDARWRLALRSADRLLAALDLGASARAAVFTRARDQLLAEHRADAPLLKAMGARWRALEPELVPLLAIDDVVDPDHALAPGLTALATRDRALAAMAARWHALGVERRASVLDAVAWSLVHMSANRLLHASHRAQELVLYDLLRRHHARRRAIARSA